MRCFLVLLVSLALSGCVVASEKPRLNTALIVPSPAASAPDGVAGRPPALTLALPATCWPNQNSGGEGAPIPAQPAPAPGRAGVATTQTAAAHAQPGPAPSTDTLARNKCIYLIKSVIDASYLDYRLRIAKQVGLTNEGLDVGMAATSAAATATTGTANKVLSALTSALTGSRSAFNNDALYQQSLQAIFKQMDADRLNVWANIQISMQADVNAYPSEEADNDLVTYFRAGTVEAAVNSLDANAGTASTACKTASDAVSSAVNSAKQGATAEVKPPSASTTGQQASATSTAEQCNQLTQAANYALGELPAKSEDVITEAKTISANVFKIPTSDKTELDEVANAVGVPISDFPTESLAIREALEKITDIGELNAMAARVKTATGQDFTTPH